MPPGVKSRRPTAVSMHCDSSVSPSVRRGARRVPPDVKSRFFSETGTKLLRRHQGAQCDRNEASAAPSRRALSCVGNHGLLPLGLMRFGAPKGPPPPSGLPAVSGDKETSARPPYWAASTEWKPLRACCQYVFAAVHAAPPPPPVDSCTEQSVQASPAAGGGVVLYRVRWRRGNLCAWQSQAVSIPR